EGDRDAEKDAGKVGQEALALGGKEDEARVEDAQIDDPAGREVSQADDLLAGRLKARDDLRQVERKGRDEEEKKAEIDELREGRREVGTHDAKEEGQERDDEL